MNVGAWGSDVPISMPVPPSQEQPGLIDIGDGFTMTAGGIAPAMDLTTFEEYVTPTYGPTGRQELNDASGS